jgi:hypothetical protein
MGNPYTNRRTNAESSHRRASIIAAMKAVLTRDAMSATVGGMSVLMRAEMPRRALAMDRVAERVEARKTSREARRSKERRTAH